MNYKLDPWANDKAKHLDIPIVIDLIPDLGKLEQTT